MNYPKLLLIPLVITFWCKPAYEPRTIQKAEIVKKVVSIQTQMDRERYVFYSLTALSIAQAVYPWVELYKGQIGGGPEPKKLSFIESVKEGFMFLFYTKEGWISIAQTVMGAGSGIVISRVCDKFVHPDTSRWYVHAHAPYALTVDMIQEQLLVLQDESLDASSFADHKEYVQLLYDRLVQQGELICAYMAYKTKRLGDEEKALAQRAARLMFMTQRSCLQSIAHQLMSEAVDYQIVDTLLDAYKKNVSSQLNHFSVIEGETFQERYIVRQLVKKAA